MTVRGEAERIVDHVPAPREIARRLGRCRHSNGGVADCVVGISFGREPEERPSGRERAAERAPEEVVRSVLQILLAQQPALEVLLLEIG